MILTIDWRSANSAGAAVTVAANDSAANTAEPKLKCIVSDSEALLEMSEETGFGFEIS